MTTPPEKLGTRVVAKSRLFTIESVDLAFSNGKKAAFERIMGGKGGVVIVMAINENSELLLVNEYATGSERYELGLVKGKVDPGEKPLQSAQRELQEEAGFGADSLVHLKTVNVNPAYSNFHSHIFVAKNLYESSLPGDEIEPLQKTWWPLDNLQALHNHPDITDVRALYCLFLLQQHIQE